MSSKNIILLNLFLLLCFLPFNKTALASENDLRVDVPIGAVITIKGDSNTLWLGTSDGLFRWDDTRMGEPKRVPADLGNVNVMMQDGNVLWIGSEKGLFRWDNPRQGAPRQIGVDTGPVSKLYKFGLRLLIGARNGLFVWSNVDSGGVPVKLELDVSHINAFYQDNTILWIGCSNGLLRWKSEGEELPQFLSEFKDTTVTDIDKGGPALLIGTSKGLIRWIYEEGQRPEQLLAGYEIYSLYRDETTTLISVEGLGLYRLDDARGGQPRLVDGDIHYSSRYYRSGETLWLGAGPGIQAGLFRWDSRKEESPEPLGSLNTGFIHDFYRSGQTLWIGSHRGLFRIAGLDTPWNAGLRIINNLPSIIYPDYEIPIKWQVSNFERRTTAALTRYRVIVKDSEGREVKPGPWNVIGQQEFVLPKLKAGTYSLNIQATDLSGHITESEPLSFTVSSSRWDVILYWAKFVPLFYLVLSTLFFFILFIGARWSEGCFDLLTGPIMRKFSLYFGLALVHWGWARRWVFRRYFYELKNKWGTDELYLPQHLISLEDKLNGTVHSPIESDEIIKLLGKKSKTLILGGPGTGKTALVKNLMRAYCSERSLPESWKKYGFIPIPISLRELADTSAIKIPELARLALAGYGVTFDTVDRFFQSLLRRGDFLIILDGLNEVHLDEAVNEFAITYPTVRLLTTSQTDSLGDSFRRYRIPFFDSEFAKTLLRKFIGDEEASKVIDEAPGLWAEIKCGYDVKLLKYLVELLAVNDEPISLPGKRGIGLPANRPELYGAMVKFSEKWYEQTTTQIKPFPLDKICERAWNMWTGGQYMLKPDESLSSQDIEHLVSTNLVVQRNESYEFIHSLMRDYLAAEFCTRYSGTIGEMLGIRLEGEISEKIWNLPTTDQDSVFFFLAEAVDKGEDLLKIFQFASDDINKRHRLLGAVKEAAEKRGLQMQVNFNSQL